MIIIRIGLIAVALILIGLIVSAGLQANMFESFGPIVSDPWGIVALVDLYAGFVVASVLIWLLEPNVRVRIGVIALLIVLGNPVALLWLAWRLPAIRKRIG